MPVVFEQYAYTGLLRTLKMREDDVEQEVLHETVEFLKSRSTALKNSDSGYDRILAGDYERFAEYLSCLLINEQGYYVTDMHGNVLEEPED